MRPLYDKNNNLIMPKAPTVRPSRTRFSEFWYIQARVRGKPYLDGPHNTKEEAYAFAFKNLQGIVFEVFSNPSRDRAQVTQREKHNILEEGAGMERAVERMKHKL